ncbi:MAG: hypothetical protein JWO09_2000 [Bacteroidetes bacterium]|nr:hypothetical protein [Bacteroidota bacterium]
MNYNVITYCLYLLITLFVVVYVGNMLFRNGCPFLLNTFGGNVQLADAINRILLAGYYLINIGYAVIVLKVWKQVASLQEMLDVLGNKAGTIILGLGIIHMFNVVVLAAIGRKKGYLILTNKNQQP